MSGRNAEIRAYVGAEHRESTHEAVVRVLSAERARVDGDGGKAAARDAAEIDMWRRRAEKSEKAEAHARDLAIGRIVHRNLGRCPESPDDQSRDGQCAACRIAGAP